MILIPLDNAQQEHYLLYYEVGKLAYIIVIDTKTVKYGTYLSPFSVLVYSANVRHSIIAARVVVKRHKKLTVNYMTRPFI